MVLRAYKGKIIGGAIGLLIGIGYALSPWKYRGGKWAKKEKKEDMVTPRKKKKKVSPRKKKKAVKKKVPPKKKRKS